MLKFLFKCPDSFTPGQLTVTQLLFRLSLLPFEDEVQLQITLYLISLGTSLKYVFSEQLSAMNI